jgi:sulfate transport system substrate-binding protein
VPVVVALVVALFGCGRSSGAGDRGGPLVLTLAAYTTPREVYSQEILPGFARAYEASHHRRVELRESYLASGAQSRAVVGGFEADVLALSLEPDVARVKAAGLVTHDWKAGERAGIVSRSIVVIGVRKGNPLGIHDWDDLARPGVEVLTPNVRTSGGAMWNVAAIYGAALRGHTSAAANDEGAAIELLARIFRNVKTMDRSGRGSMLTFERGVGDAIITYENEILVGQRDGHDYEYVVPRSTLSIENPVAVVDAYAARHGVTDAARAFVAYLFTAPPQRAFAAYGYRPVLPSVIAETRDRFPAPEDLFTVRDLGDWASLDARLFAAGAAYDRALARARAEASR